MSEDELQRIAYQWGTVDQARLQDGQMGIWVPSVRMIILDDRLSPAQRRCVLAHEISHARHGDTACAHTGAMEARADREAACMLISPMEYAFAEQIYGQNIHGIAQELGVMPWVVDAYRGWLHDHAGLVIQ